LGSLVCYKRADGSFEIIDGQQRYTALTLINLVLKNRQETMNMGVKSPNLKFDSRKKAQDYIERLYETENSDFQRQVEELSSESTGHFKAAIEIAQEELNTIGNLQIFAKNFYEKVRIFRTEVPEGTDLNHYFEIMNNRGEQLEKHEIVKAQLMGNKEKIGGPKEQEKFAKIWDACADMSNYVYFNFSAEDRKKIFKDNGDLKEKNFEDIELSDENIFENEAKTLLGIIDGHTKSDLKTADKEIREKYRSVIDFPNFLLQVLKIKDENVSLDDKKLLEQFKKVKLEPKEFIFDLLKYRFLFDKFVIKQDLTEADESKQNWGIRKLKKEVDGTVRTFENDEKNGELVKLQAMLHYSHSANTYKNWLQEIMKSIDSADDIDTYTENVWEIAKGNFDDKNLSYPNITAFNLYFIDFLLWKLYAEKKKGLEKYVDDDTDELNGLKKKIDNRKKQFNSFKFTQLSSREHLLSRSQGDLQQVGAEVVNGIGNLCLISASDNSSGNKESPGQKRDRFKGKNSSLKRLIMFEGFEGEKWGKPQIEAHKKEIMDLIKHYC